MSERRAPTYHTIQLASSFSTPLTAGLPRRREDPNITPVAALV